MLEAIGAAVVVVGGVITIDQQLDGPISRWVKARREERRERKRAEQQARWEAQQRKQNGPGPVVKDAAKDQASTTSRSTC